jgi:RNA 3'-terminal phosphate cyclase (ATP)
MSDSLVELDGSQGEGGGQILRSCLSLALLTGKAFQLHNVRARRARPGLQPQHLMSVQAAARIGSAHVRGASLGSSELTFEPGPVAAGHYHFPIRTAGATGLVLHTLYLPLALRGAEPSEVVVEGGTHNDHSPCFHFLDTTWRPYLERLGLKVRLKLRRPGFYPRGGGAVEMHVTPCSELRPLRLLERSPATRIEGFSAVAGLPEEIAARQSRQATRKLRDTGLKVNLREESWDGGSGTVIALTLDTTPVPTLFFGLGARGKRAEHVADEAVEQLREYLSTAPAAVDPHSADQLILPLAFAAGPSTFTVSKVTAHLRTNVDVVRRFVERDIVCEGEEGATGIVRVGF